MIQIIGLITAIPKILDTVRAILGFIEANKNERWFQDSARIFSALRAAKTEEEYRNAAKNIRDILGRL